MYNEISKKLMNELPEEYGLSPIETIALVKRVALFKDEQQNGGRDKPSD